MSEPRGLIPYDDRAVNIIRGKSLLMPPDIGEDVRKICYMLDWFENKLDDCDDEDMFGTDGWRHYFGVEGA